MAATHLRQRLSGGDIRRIFHLVCEISELGRDSIQWREHMLSVLLPMIGARVGITGEHFINAVDATDTRIVGLAAYGWDTPAKERLFAYMRAGDFAHDPFHAGVMKLTHRSSTRRRCDLVSDELWYGSPLVNEMRQQSNTDDQIYSRWKLPQKGWAHFISPMRAWSAPRFSPRDRLVVNYLHRELGRLWNQAERGDLAPLPPRLRQTLDLIFSGYSEKEMAEALNVSALTAHDFCRRLYRHFGVSGRGELLVNAACRQLLFRPTLSPAYYANDRGDEVFPEGDETKRKKHR